ncbi:MAG: helix-turn-helix domain-containing protein [Phaeodactylibacter sp.]|nr:helix-turn-helix domain-containing protein [Phaeodactylibacter sp.]MCB9290928.1 helix-turn-helix domain-containing protein [Lewinellaceae bacterium]
MILLTVWPLIFFAQSREIPFQHITLGRGQDVNMVYEILQDKQGFIWFGTFNGLVRYDGYRFRHWPYDPETRHPLKGKRVNGLLESPSGKIWILSGQMLLSYDPRLDTFYTVDNLGGDSLIRYRNSRYNEVFLQDSSGDLWLRSQRGLFRVREKQEGGQAFEVKHYQHSPGDSSSLSSNVVNALLYDSRHRLWIGAENGFNFFDRENGRMVRLTHGCNAAVSSLCEMASGEIWIGTRQAGLWVYDPEKNTFSNYLPADGREAKNALSIAGKWVKQIVRDGKGNLWLLAGSAETQVVALQRFAPDSGRFDSYFEPFPPTGLSKNSVAQMFVGGDGLLWVATGLGLKRFDPYREVFADIRQREPYLKDWSLHYSFYESPGGNLWIGTVSRGVLKYAPSTDKFRFYPPPDFGGKNIYRNLIKSLYEDSHGYLWRRTAAGTFRYAFDKNDELQETAHFPFYAGNFFEDSSGRLWMGNKDGVTGFNLEAEELLPSSVLPNSGGLDNFGMEDREGWFWSASWGKGLKRYNPSTGEVVQYLHEPGNPHSIGSNNITPVMLEDVEGNLWFNGVNGLKKYDLATGHFTNYLKGVETVYSIWGSDSILWATTSGRGLYRFNIHTGESQCYSPQNGFPTIRPITPFQDTQGNLWMSSDVGVIRFDPVTETAQVFDESDGLPGVVFSYGSCQRENGEFFFPLWEGGFIRFHPDSLRSDTILPRPAIVEFQLSNQPVEIGAEGSPLSHAIWATEHLVLKHNQNNFTLGFTAFHYAAPAQNQFLYKMEGIDAAWIDPGSQRSVNFAGLAPGKYTFRLKAANHDGLWSEPVALRITILPPWWAAWWAYGLYALLIAGLLYTYYRLQLRRRLAEAEAQRLREQFANHGWFRLMQNGQLQFHDEFLKKLNRALEENYADENFDIPQLSEAMHLSRAQLYRKVKNLTGKPVGQVLRSYRMRRARALLETTDLSVSQVAVEVGFKHLPHFSRSFQQEFGVKPSEMRK